MPPVNLRHAVRALLFDEGGGRILLCRFAFVRAGGTLVVWAAPGGGVERGETSLDALRRELREEVGFALEGEPPHVWHQVVVDPAHAPGYDGVVNDYFLVRTPHFAPRGALTDEQLAAENVTGLRWWHPEDIRGYRGSDVFSPRDLGGLLARLDAGGLPGTPVPVGL
ncbi:NUDIX domain-containing protein [Streptomyces sp. NRRL F-5123]|uniref:NUDIX domain-containing protein n=1 Tax=Streptomyces sp. NRRL F-5123 TaxID=1463856 RepID=UPI0004E22D0D|nr:NUDIX domain-containing protein [Streptomyces sp. NRRL F-5123]